MAWRWVVSSLDGWSCGALAVHGAEARVCRTAPELGHQPALSRAPGYALPPKPSTRQGMQRSNTGGC